MNIASEVSDVAMCFDLVTNTVHFFIRDVSDDSDDDGESYDDHCVVMDLDSGPRANKNDSRNMRGSQIICDIISPFHDGSIAEAGENKELIEAYAVNETVFILDSKLRLGRMSS